jgi:hypothetical protein
MENFYSYFKGLFKTKHRFVQTKFNSAETEIIETEINKMLGK